MYDFYFGTEKEIQKDEKKFLQMVKRMLPRWVNSIPDSEYAAIYDSLVSLKTKSKQKILVETGVGASTIVLLYYAMKTNGCLYTWDLHAERGAYIRSVCVDTLQRVLNKNVFDHWKLIAFDSRSPYLGVPILKELVDHVDFCFFDSEHTLNTLLAEVKAANSLLVDDSIVAIDDANYNFRHTNVSYINILRRKLGLAPIADNLKDNHCEPFYKEVENYLKENWSEVAYIKDTYKNNYKNDIFWSYYQADREVIAIENMEKLNELDHRYDSWTVKKRKNK